MTEKLDVDGLHDLIVMLQRSGKLEAKIRLSNLGRFKRDFPHFFNDGDETNLFFHQAHASHLNHFLMEMREMLRNDPTWQMLGKLVMLECHK